MNRSNYEGKGRHRRQTHHRGHRRHSHLRQIDPRCTVHFPLGRLMALAGLVLAGLLTAAGTVVPPDPDVARAEFAAAEPATVPEQQSTVRPVSLDITPPAKCSLEPTERPIERPLGQFRSVNHETGGSD